MLKFAPFITIYNFDESSDIQTEVIWAFSINLKGISSVRHRLNIHLVHSPEQEQQNVHGSILSVWKYASVSIYSELSKQEQKHFLLKLIYESLLEIVPLHNWNSDRISTAFEKTISSDIQFSYSSRANWNKRKSTKAATELILSENKISVWIIFSLREINKTVKIHLIDTSPIQLTFFGSFDKPCWIDDSNFGFRFKNGMTLTTSPVNESVVWSVDGNKEDEWFRKTVDLNEKVSQEEMLKIMNL
jgi:hypothetical protein